MATLNAQKKKKNFTLPRTTVMINSTGMVKEMQSMQEKSTSGRPFPVSPFRGFDL